MPLTAEQLRVYREVTALTAPFYTVQNQNDFQRNLADGRPNTWQCGAGGRYLYICEDGLVHWCSQQRGYPGIPLREYTVEMRHQEYLTKKFCAPKCTVSCVQQVAMLDNWRDPQNLRPSLKRRPAPVPQPQLVQLGSAPGPRE